MALPLNAPHPVLSLQYQPADPAAGFAPVVTSSIDLYLGSGTTGQASCALFATEPQFGDKRLSQDAFVDFTSTNDDEQLMLVGHQGFIIDSTASGLIGDSLWTIELRCTETAGDVRFDRGDLVLQAIPLG